MEDETKAGGEEVMKQNVAEQSSETVEGKEVLSRVLEDDSSLDSIVKPVVEEVTQTVQSLVQNVADHSSSYVTQLKTGFANLALVSDPWTSLTPVQESSDVGKSEPAQQENADLDEHSRAIHTQV